MESFGQRRKPHSLIDKDTPLVLIVLGAWPALWCFLVPGQICPSHAVISLMTSAPPRRNMKCFRGGWRENMHVGILHFRPVHGRLRLSSGE